MLRVTELKLRLDHSEAELRAAVAQRLEVDEAALGECRSARRAQVL